MYLERSIWLALGLIIRKSQIFVKNPRISVKNPNFSFDNPRFSRKKKKNLRLSIENPRFLAKNLDYRLKIQVYRITGHLVSKILDFQLIV